MALLYILSFNFYKLINWKNYNIMSNSDILKRLKKLEAIDYDIHLRNKDNE